MYLSSIFEYPVKGLRGYALQAAEVGPLGIEMDRRFMIVDDQNRFVTQRTHPELTRFSVSVNNLLNIKDNRTGGSISTEIVQDGKGVIVTIWDDQCEAVLQGSEVNAWLSELLDGDFRLVYMNSLDARPTDPDFSAKGDHVSFADGYPILLTNERSLELLNSKLETPIGMDRFRANFVIDGDVPFEEDNWQRIRIGEVELKVVKPCARCQVITTDQNTGERSKEPLRTLSTFREVNNRVLFGVNAIPVNSGTVSVGDRLEIIGY